MAEAVITNSELIAKISEAIAEARAAKEVCKWEDKAYKALADFRDARGKRKGDL